MINNENLIREFHDFLIKRKSQDIAQKTREFTNILGGKRNGRGVYDEIIDFIDLRSGNYTRWEAFARYIETRYIVQRYISVLDVGCGPFADLSIKLAEKGYDVTSIDPRIEETSRLKIIKGLFDFESTDVKRYDLIVGLEPCEATEHIIRSAVANKKAFAICLCGIHHEGIDGKVFETYDEWVNYLIGIDKINIMVDERYILGKNFKIIRNIS